MNTLTYSALEATPVPVVFAFSTAGSAQRVPEPDPLPGISFDTRPDPIQF